MLLWFSVIISVRWLASAETAFDLATLDMIAEMNGQQERKDHHIGTKMRSLTKQRPKETTSGWSEWSPWETCSRSCDGGITFSMRTCSKVKSGKRKDGRKMPCEGEPIRRRICNMQPCPEPNDFRGTQCSAYDAKPYRERLYSWLPFYDPEDPCTLRCQAKGYNFVVKLSTRVQDGTRCRDGALDMCVDGQCKQVGCDLEVGSILKVDQCGVCGGDGSSCSSAPTFVWAARPYEPCPVSCGGGVQISEPACRQKGIDQEVDHRLCDRTIRPRSKSRPCNPNPCPVVWHPGDWGPCSATCGPGIQRRSLQCVQGGPNGTQVVVQTEFCPRHKPHLERSCIIGECPRWFQGIWSTCSATCGIGVQSRAVVCRNDKGQYSEDCNLATKPEIERPCDTSIPCPRTEETPTPAPCITVPDTTSFPPINESDPFPPDDVIEGTPAKSIDSSGETRPLETAPPPVEPEITTSSVSIDSATYHIGPWSICSSICGPGHRRRPVQCQIFLDFPHTVAVLPDGECHGPRPLDLERCSVWCIASQMSSSTPTPYPDGATVASIETRIGISTLPPKPYVWKVIGFTPCTANCAGGSQRTKIICVRRLDGTEVPGRFCNPGTKPDIEERICNDFPCPARWNVSEFSECSASCGGGLRIRVVQCLQEERRRGTMHGGTSQLREVEFQKCRPPPPEDRQFCNVLDCPPRWKSEAWSKCSVSCGGGFQTRKLRCEMTVAHPPGNTVELPPSKCLKARPKASKPCNRKPCPWPKASQLSITDSTTMTPAITTTIAEDITEPPQNESAILELNQRRVTTKASGKASVLKGSTVKVHCPHSLDHQPNPDFPVDLNDTRGDLLYPHVLWFKGRRRFSNRQPDRKKSARVSVSARGALKIRKVNFADAGIYTCLAGPFRSDLELFVRPLPPGGFPEDIKPSPEGEIYEKTIPEEEESHSAEPKVEKQATDDLTSPNKNYVNSKPFSSDNLPQIRHIQVNKEHFIDKDYDDSKHADKPLSADSERQRDPDFIWQVGSWSPCTHTCGKDGLQVRELRCVVQLRYNRSRTSETRPVSGALCTDRGFIRPPTARTCEKDPCPMWIAGPWSQCSTSNCVALNTAYQKREVKCSGEDVCKEHERPRRKRECFQPSCKSLWKIGPWSKCTITCGDNGIRLRRVECVWFGSGLQAGANACKDLEEPSPVTVVPCKGPPCDENPVCINHSSYCEVVRQTKLCRMSHFRLQCCASCTGILY